MNLLGPVTLRIVLSPTILAIATSNWKRNNDSFSNFELKTDTTVLGKGVIPQLEKGDVLGHECCGVVDSVGPEAKNINGIIFIP
jgi:threonine dehydrogenase-like Zn-dependent dehydrogenase